MKALGLAFLAVLTTGPLRAERPLTVKLEPDAAWMRLYSETSPWAYYLEIAKDGSVTTRTETGKTVSTRSGRVPERLAKDLFQEIDSAQSSAAQEINKGHLLFYKGKMIQISIYAKGEFRTFEALLSNMGAGFSHAFKLAQAEAAKLKAAKNSSFFLTAKPLEKKDLDALAKHLKNPLVMTETSDIKNIPQLTKAITRPWRLIPMSPEQTDLVRKFTAEHSLEGTENMFYLSTSRGTFSCSILDSSR